MSRLNFSRQESYAPYPAGTVPHVTDEDFGYIAAPEDVDGPYVLPDSFPLERNAPPHNPRQNHRHHTHQRHQPEISVHDELEEADVLFAVLPDSKSELPLEFPAYSIDEGRLQVRDICRRVALLIDAPAAEPYISITYKEQPLTGLFDPAKKYGIKNHSRVVCTIPDLRDLPALPENSTTHHHKRKHSEARPSPDVAETIVIDERGRIVQRERDSRSQPTLDHHSPPRRFIDMGNSSSRSKSHAREPQSSTHTTTSAPSPATNSATAAAAPAQPTAPPSAMQALADIENHFDQVLKPQLEAFVRSPPSDKSKRDEEHRKLSELTLQQVLFKADAIDADGDQDVRAARRNLVTRTQSALEDADRVHGSSHK